MEKKVRNKHGYLGVVQAGNKYYGVYYVNCQKKNTKAFATPKEAHEARIKAMAELE